MRILHVISGDLFAGAEVMALTLIREQSRMPSNEVRVVLLNDGILAEKLRAEGVVITVLHEQQHGGFWIFRALVRICREFRPGVVHTHRKKENVLGAVAARLTGAKSLRTVHGWTEFPHLGLHVLKHLWRWLDVATGRYLQGRIVAVSADLGQQLLPMFGAGRLSVVENGVDLDAVRSARNAPASLPGGPGAKRVGIVARLVPVKRHDRFVEAALLLLGDGHTDYHFYIVGDGPQSGAIESLIRQCGHGDRFHMLGFREDVLQVIAALDALVVCSDHEGTPMSVLEAAALAVPIVTVPLPSIAAVLASGARGVIAAGGTGRAIADAIDKALAAPRGAMLDDSWKYSARQMAAGYQSLYSDLLVG